MLVLSDLPNNYYAAWDRFTGDNNTILTVSKLYKSKVNPIPHPSIDKTVLEFVCIISVEKSKVRIKDSLILDVNTLSQFGKALRDSELNSSNQVKCIKEIGLAFDDITKDVFTKIFEDKTKSYYPKFKLIPSTSINRKFDDTLPCRLTFVLSFGLSIENDNASIYLTNNDYDGIYENTPIDGAYNKELWQYLIPIFEKRVYELLDQPDAPPPQPINTNGIEGGMEKALEKEAEEEGQNNTKIEEDKPKPPKQFLKPEVDDIIRVGSDQFAIVDSIIDDNIVIKNISQTEAMDILKARKKLMDNLVNQVSQMQ